MSLKNLSIVTAKLAISGTVICLIAGLFLILTEEGQVTEAQADVTDLLPGGPSQHHRFERVMKRAGLDGQPFDHNGNIVKFAVGESHLTPNQLMDYFQRELRREGVNTKAYGQPLVDLPQLQDEFIEMSSSEESEERNLAMLRGEVVPLIANQAMMAMGGLVPKKKREDIEDFLETWTFLHNGDIDPRANIGGFRAIEARLDPNTGRSTVTATWSEPGFDAYKANAVGRTRGASPDAEVPTCIGCERRHRLEGLGEHHPFVLNQLFSPASMDTNRQFYSAALERRGWEPASSMDILDEIRPYVPELDDLYQDMLTFERNGQTLNFLFDDNGDGQTSIIAIQGPEAE